MEKTLESAFYLIKQKVDAVFGKSLVDDAQITKLAGIEENANYYVHPATHSADIITDGTTNKAYTATEKTKLAGIATGAQVNNISDVNATDLTDGGATTLHTHDARYYTESEIDTKMANVWATIYPVGAIYISVVSTSPATLFGGTWSALADRFLIGASASYPVGSTGGATSHDHTSPAHSHTVNSHTHTSPAHTHGGSGLFAHINISTSLNRIYMAKGTYAWTGAPSTYLSGSASSTANPDSNTTGAIIDGTTESTTPGATGGTALTTNGTTPGNTGSGSSLPPYLAVYMWKRTA